MIRSIQIINCFNDDGSSESGNTTCYPPLGVISIASYLKKNNAQLHLDKIEVIDGDRYSSLSEIEALIDADIIGFSVLSANYKNSLHLAKFAKGCGRLVVFGNDHASHLAKQIMEKHTEVDYIISGDNGELSLFQLINELNGEKRLSAVDNLHFRIFGNIEATRCSYKSIKTLPMIDMSVIDDYTMYFNNYNARYGRWHDYFVRNMSTNFAKGCSWGSNKKSRCLYCDIYDLNIDFVHPNRVWEQLLQMKERYNINWIYEVCDNFTSLDRVYFEKTSYIDLLIKTKPSNLDIEWFVYARASDINDKLLIKLKEIGVRRLNIGLDSGDNSTLRTLNKGATFKRNIQALEKISRHGFQLYSSIVLASANETHESLENTIAFAEMACDICAENLVALTVSPLLPLPGSKAWVLLLDQNAGARYGAKHGFTPKYNDDFFEKYGEKDCFDLHQLANDWINTFCGASVDEVWSASKRIQEICAKSSIFTGGFGIPDK